MASTQDPITLQSFPNLGANPKSPLFKPIDPIQAAIDHFRYAQSMFDSPDADMLLVCLPHHPEATSIEYTFKVHRPQLTRVSAVFADMVAVSTGHDDSGFHTADVLPRVPMREDWQIVFVLLGHAYQNAEVMQACFCPTFDKFDLEVYDAAQRYGFDGVVIQARTHLSVIVHSVAKQDALAIYVRASVYNDHGIMAAALPYASEVCLTTLSIEDLRVLSATASKNLIAHQNDKVRLLIDRVLASHHHDTYGRLTDATIADYMALMARFP